VEAAKEFYMDRLQQEWQDAAAAAAAADEAKGHCCPPSLPFNKTKVVLLPKNSKIRGFGFKRKPYRYRQEHICIVSVPVNSRCSGRSIACATSRIQGRGAQVIGLWFSTLADVH
jgi:hypothetical protein